MSKGGRVRYYDTFSDDFVQSHEQQHRLPENYRFIRESLPSRILSGIIYGIAFVFSLFYCGLFLGVRFKKRNVIRGALKDGGFIYCNHTQSLGDVFIPALACRYNRIYTVVSPANFGIPVIGKILPFLGALPVPDSIKGMKKFNEAVLRRVNDGHFIAVFPEAHVWDYYTEIRPFPAASFKLAVNTGKPAYSMTVTYKKRRFRKRPAAVVFIDGPFYPDTSLHVRERSQRLCDEVYKTMCERSKNSDCRYIEYRKK